MVQRYDMMVHENIGAMVTQEDGEWVEYTDYEKDIRELVDALSACNNKLMIMRTQTNGEYAGGMEYSYLQDMVKNLISKYKED